MGRCCGGAQNFVVECVGCGEVALEIRPRAFDKGLLEPSLELNILIPTVDDETFSSYN